jgi:phospholipase C
MVPELDHAIVLVLANRSFDQLLGFLPSSNADFDGLLGGGPYQNHGYDGGPAVTAQPTGKHVLPYDPDCSHDAVMLQLDVRGAGPGRHATNQGFVDSYERRGQGLATPTFGGLLSPIANRWFRSAGTYRQITSRGPLIMRCLAPENVPVLTELASSFGVCSKWFASVPGGTWPNRNFLHAATSDGTVDNELRFYRDPTIFELLEQRGKSWHVYHDDTPQLWAFNHLWMPPERRRNWFRTAEFVEHVQSGQLPNYSFIEPNHRPAQHALPFVQAAGLHGHSNSQHPSNNRFDNAEYDDAPPSGHGDFERGESLIAEVYEALRANPEVFARSVLLVTYDHHGGFYDHVPPPTDATPPGDPHNPGLLGQVAESQLRRKAASFDFTMYGPRVPAVVVSPFVSAGTVSADVRDHASVPTTLRALFAPDAEPLTGRDERAVPFHTLLTLDLPRRGGDLPDLSAHLPGTLTATADAELAQSPAFEAGAEPPLPEYYQDFVVLADEVAAEMARVAPAGAAEALASPASGPLARAQQATAAFTAAAEAARRSS